MIFICTIKDMTEVELAKILASDLNLKLKLNELGASLYLGTHFVDSLGSFMTKSGTVLRLFNIPPKPVFDKIRKKAKRLPYIAAYKGGALPAGLFGENDYKKMGIQ